MNEYYRETDYDRERLRNFVKGQRRFKDMVAILKGIKRRQGGERKEVINTSFQFPKECYVKIAGKASQWFLFHSLEQENFTRLQGC